jgi:ATP phosphoribosyltransferase
MNTFEAPITTNKSSSLHLGLPKGRMYSGVIALMAEAGISIRSDERTYRPTVSLDGLEVKILKPQNIAQMLHLGSRDIGFAGRDWVVELGVDIVELLDTGLDPVRLVAAAPSDLLESGKLPSRRLIVASEYENLSKGWIEKKEIDAKVIRTYGATEVFPPEDADCIVDNTASGATLRANGLLIVDELMRSSTCLYASRSAMDNREKRNRIEDIVLLLSGVLAARRRVMLEVNVTNDCLDAVVALLPAMKKATVSPLQGTLGFAVKAAVLKAELPRVIPMIKAAGGTDIAVTALSQIVP